MRSRHCFAASVLAVAGLASCGSAPGIDEAESAHQFLVGQETPSNVPEQAEGKVNRHVFAWLREPTSTSSTEWEPLFTTFALGSIHYEGKGPISVTISGTVEGSPIELGVAAGPGSRQPTYAPGTAAVFPAMSGSSFSFTFVSRDPRKVGCHHFTPVWRSTQGSESKLKNVAVAAEFNGQKIEKRCE